MSALQEVPGHGVTLLKWVRNTSTPLHKMVGKILALPSVAADIRVLAVWKENLNNLIFVSIVLMLLFSLRQRATVEEPP